MGSLKLSSVLYFCYFVTLTSNTIDSDNEIDLSLFAKSDHQGIWKAIGMFNPELNGLQKKTSNTVEEERAIQMKLFVYNRFHSRSIYSKW